MKLLVYEETDKEHENNLWGYQKHCFSCEIDQSFDLENLKWVNEWNDESIKIQSTQMNIPSIWRRLEYYVDPFSNKGIELGTKEFPYRTMKAANSDIINNFSYKNMDITIYMTHAYVQDEVYKYINMSSITIKRHPDLEKLRLKSMLIPTTIVQPGIMDKTLFILLKNTEFQPIESNLSSIEQLRLDLSKVTIMALRTSIIIDSINIYREEINEGTSQFLLPILLQNKTIKISKI